MRQVASAARLVGLAVLLGSPLLVSAQVIPYPGRVTVTVTSNDLASNTLSPVAQGWEDIGAAEGQSFGALRLKVVNTVPAQFTYLPGGDLHVNGTDRALELQVAMRVSGQGRWPDGRQFDTALGWTDWEPWVDCDDKVQQPMQVVFERPQQGRVEIRARVLRHDVSDIAGSYGQTVAPRVTAAPLTKASAPAASGAPRQRVEGVTGSGSLSGAAGGATQHP